MNVVVRLGMRKDFILTTEEKQSKKQRLEENRRLRSTDLPAKLVSPSALTEADWTCLNDLRRAYTTATQSSPSASSMLSLNLAPDKMSAFMNTLDIQNFTAVKLINFLREVPEFSELNDGDRLILVKYNLTLLFIVRHSLTFDSNREIYYDLDSTGAVSPAEEAFAHHCKSLFILCFGYEFNQAAMSLLHALVALVNRDPLVVQLLMLIMIFSKGLSADDDQQPILLDPQSVFRAQSKYTDLLFRYLMEKNAFERVIDKMTRITELLLKIQRVSRDFQQYLKSKVDLTHVNPLMKSLLHLT